MLSKAFKALLLLGALLFFLQGYSQCYHCSAPSAPAEYGGAFNVTMYKNAKVQLWAAKTSVAVDNRQWYRVKKSGDTTYVGSGDTMTFTMDTTSRFICRNVNNCTCGGTYYSTYASMALITVVDSPSVPIYWFTYDSVICSGSPTNIFTYTNSGLSNLGIQYLRDDTPNVTGSVTGTSSSVGPLGITLTNTTGTTQTVRFVLRMYKNGSAYFDSKSFYIKVLPGTPSGTDQCSFPSKPVHWPLTAVDVSTYSKSAHVQFIVDTTVIATAVQWFKVVGTDTSYVGDGYSIPVTIDTPAKYLARSKNTCTCNGSTYYSAYTLIANYSVANSFVSNVNPFSGLDTIASGTGIDIIPRTDTSAYVTMTLYRDNANVTGTTTGSTSANYATVSQVFDWTLTNTTNIPQRVKYQIKSQIWGGSYGDTYTGYITVMPSAFTAPAGNHCYVPERPRVGLNDLLTYSKGAKVYLDLHDATFDVYGTPHVTLPVADNIQWYKSKGPGDTTFVGNVTPVSMVVDTNYKTFAVSENVCYWPDSSKHVYKSAMQSMTTWNASSSTPQTFNSVINAKPNLCNGDSANISYSMAASIPGMYWYRSNTSNVTGQRGASALSGTSLIAKPALTDTVDKPQKVYIVSYTTNSGAYSTQRLDSVTVYPDCSRWASFSTAIHASKDSICPGDTAALTADTVPGLGNRYAWSTGDTTKTIHRTAAGTYTVTVTNLCGCSATASLTTVAKPAAQLFINTSGPICSGDSGIILARGSDTYLWSTGDSTESIIVKSSGAYTVTAYNSYDCHTIAIIPISIYSNPVVFAGSDISVCAGGFVQIGNMDSVFSGTPPYAYSWEPAELLSNPNMSHPFTASSSSAPFILTITDSNGCKGYDTLMLTVRAIPLVNAGIDRTIQVGESTFIGDTVIATAPIAMKTWHPSTQMINPGQIHQIVSPLTTTIYVETIIDSLGCLGADSLVVTVSERADTALIIAFSDTSVGIIDSLIYGDTITVRTQYLDLGGNYADSIMVYQQFACDSCVKVKHLRLYAGYTITPSLEITDPVFPLSLPLSVNKYSPVRLEQDIYLGYDSCLPLAGCTAHQSLRYKSAPSSKLTTNIPITILPAANSTIPGELEVLLYPFINDCATGDISSAVHAIPYEIQVYSNQEVTSPFTITISGLRSALNNGLMSTPPNWTVSPSGTDLILTYTPTTPASQISIDYIFEQGPLACVSGSLEAVGTNSITLSAIPFSNGSASVSLPGFLDAPLTAGTPFIYSYPGAPQFPSHINQANLTTATTPNVVVNGTSVAANVGITNSGTSPYIGDITIENSGGCSSMLLQRCLLVVDNVVVATVSSSPYTFTNVSIPPNTTFSILEEFEYTGSLCQQVTCPNITPSITWGCCAVTTILSDIHFESQVIGDPVLDMAEVGLNSDAICPGAQRAWDFKISNSGGPADNLRAVIDMGTIESNTYIIASSIDVRDNSNNPVAFNILSADYLTSSDYTASGLNVPSCLSSIPSTPMQSCTIAIGPALGASDEYHLHFSTYKCCPSDNEFKSRYFNQVTLRVTGENCTGTQFTAPAILNGYNISREGLNTYTNRVFNFGIEQYAVPDVVDMVGGAGTCSDFYDFKVQNRIFNNPSNDPNTPSRAAFTGDRDDAVLYCSGASGANPGGQFKVRIDWTGNLFGDHVANDFYIQGARGGVWLPTSSLFTFQDPPTNTGAGYLEAVFDIANLRIPATNQVPVSNAEFKDFFIGSTIHFGLKTCCDNPVAYPIITASTLFDFDAYSSCTDHCWTGLSQVTFHPSVRCPGCKTPGMLITDYSTIRTTLGFVDDDNDGRPLSVSSSATGLQPLTLSSLTPQQRSQLKLDRSMKGDIILSETTGLLFGGENRGPDPNSPPNPCGNNAFSISDWETFYPGYHFDNFYLEQVIDNSYRAGLTPLSTTVEYTPSGGTPSTPVSITSVTQTSGLGIGGNDMRFVYAINAASFGSGHFGAGDRFVVRTMYQECKSPVNVSGRAENIDLKFRNRMFVTPLAITSLSNPFAAPLAADAYTNHCNDLSYVGPNQSYPYFCQGFDGVHRVYGIDIGSKELYTATSACSRALTLEYYERLVTDPNETNVFPFEYRLMPGIDPQNMSIGMGIIPPGATNNTKVPMQAVVNPSANLAYSYSPAYIMTYANVYNGPLVSVMKSRTDNVSSITASFGNTYSLATGTAPYMPYYDGLANSSVTTIPTNTVAVYQNGQNTLLLGDESFIQDFVFDINTNCSASPPASLTMNVAAAANYALVPDISACNPSSVSGWSTRTILDNVAGRISPISPQASMSISTAAYSGNTMTFTMHVTSNYVPNCYLVIKEDGQGHPIDNSGQIIQGVTVEVFKDGVSISAVPTSGGVGYYGYSLDPYFWNRDHYSDGNFNLQIVFTITDCSSVKLDYSNMISQITEIIPTWIVWNCNPINWTNAVQTTLCNTPTEFDASFVIYNPIFRLSSSITHLPSQYIGCSDEVITMCASNSGGFNPNSILGTVGNVKFEVTVPASVTVDAINSSFSIGTGTAIAVPSGAISVSSVSGGNHTYTIDLSSYTGFTSSQVGGNGFASEDGNICLSLSLLPGCNATGTIPVSFNASADPYCAPSGSNRVYAEQYPLSTSILPDLSTNLCNPPVLTATPHDVSCNGASNSGSIDLSVTGGLATYQYSLDGTNFTSFAASSGTATITGLSSGSYTITVKDANDCLGTATVTLGVNGGIDITSIESHGACANSNNGYITLGLTGASPYVYTWNNGSPGSGITDLAASTYYLTITDANGCTATATVDVDELPDCCTPYYPELSTAQNNALVFNVISITSTDFLSTLSTAGFSSYVNSNSLENFPYQIVIMGDLDLDDDLELINCPNITFSINGLVTTNGYSLYIQGSQLYSCGPDTWGGIDANDPAAQVAVMPPTSSMGPTEIRDARIAISGSNAASVILEGGSFISNWEGIVYDGSSGLGDFKIYNTTFTSYVDAGGNTSIKNVIFPVASGISRGNRGVYVYNLPSNVSGLVIGDNNQGVNTFGYLEAGIVIDKCFATIENNIFTHIVETPRSNFTSLFPYVGNCIFFQSRTPSISPIYNLNIHDNTFSSGIYGIHTESSISRTSISYNTFTGPLAYTTRHIGILVNRDSRAPQLSITHNTMSISGTDRLIDWGIIVRGATGTGMDISYNDITTVNYALHEAGANAMRPTIAIDVEGSSPPLPRSPFGTTVTPNMITYNQITDAQYGIKTMNCSGINANNNAIAIYAKGYSGNVVGTPKWCGILTRADGGMNYSLNNIDCDYRAEAPTYALSAVDFTAGKLVGILIDQQVGTNSFLCNQVSNGHWGIAAKGPGNYNAQSLNVNTVDNCIIGDLSLSLGWFGTQGGTPLYPGASVFSTNGNQWTNMTSSTQHRLGVVNRTYTSIAAQQAFYVDCCNPNYNPDLGYPTATTQLIYSSGGLPPDIFPILAGGNRHSNSNCSVIPSIDRIALAVSENRSFYEAVAQRTIAMDSTDADSLYTRRWMELGLLSMAVDYPDMLDSSTILHDTIAAMLTRSEWQLAYINYMMIADSTDSMVSAHLTANAVITPADQWQANLKAVNALYLSRYALSDTSGIDTVSFISSGDQKLLLAIATNCVYTGGPAVYQAQALYWRAADTLEFFNDLDCVGGDSMRMAYVHFADETAITVPYNFRLYPTLISVNGTFQTQSSEAGKIFFYNALGQLVYKAPVQRGNTIFNCQSLGCPNEILLYKAQLDNGHTESGKIVIMK